jgi:hypothetical protein
MIFTTIRKVGGGGNIVLLGGILHVRGFLGKYFGGLC